jgi:cytosine permease
MIDKAARGGKLKSPHPADGGTTILTGPFARTARESAERGEGLAPERSGAAAPGALRIALVLIAGLVALPAFAIGAELDGALGVKGVIEASLGGGAILACVAVLAAIAGARSGLSTYALIINAFGSHGGQVVNVVLAAVLLGWFGVTLTMFSDAATRGLDSLGARSPPLLWAVAGSAVMTMTALIGFRAMEAVARISTPLKFILLFWAAFAALAAHVPGSHAGASLWQAPAVQKMSILSATSLAAGGLIAGASLTPDLCRFARSPTQGAIGSAIAFFLGFPLVLSVAAIPAQMTGQRDIVLIMIGLGLGIPALVIVALAAWSLNAQNLYSTSLMFATLAPRQTHRRLALVAGGLGTVVGLSGLAGHLIPFLSILSIGIPPVAGVYLTQFYMSGHEGWTAPAGRWRATAFASWAIGSGVAGLEVWWRFTLSSVTAIDTLVVSACAFAAIRFATDRMNPQPALAPKKSV